jgi:metallo-beta-lactamase family protein
MKITFLGAARTVTGSCFLLETKNTSMLVDCGMYQGRKTDTELNEADFPFNVGDLDYIFLTHSHIDHSGRIPKIYKDGFKGEILATKACVELCSIMLPDSGHIQEFENEWINRKRERAGKEPIEPLYTSQDAIDSMKLFRSIEYNEIINVNNEVSVRFNDAGHILGSAVIEVWLYEGEKEIKLVFTGDLGNHDIPILREPSIIKSADYLICESTYGDRLHEDNKDKFDKFMNAILDTLDRGGNIIIPSFAVGRAQEIIYELNKQYGKDDPKFNKLLKTPVFVDSPLAINATEIFRNNVEFFDEEAQNYIEAGDHPLDFENLKFTRTADESKALNAIPGSKIIISASGMCDAGRIKHHLKHNLWRKDSTVLFVGYQAQGTLGRKIVDGAEKVRIFGEEVAINAKIQMIDGFSGHADKNGLISWIKKIENPPIKVFLVHGEEDSIKSLSEALEDKLNLLCEIPYRNDAYLLNTKKAIETTDKNIKSIAKHTYKRLEVLEYLDKIREEYDEVIELVKIDLKKGIYDKKAENIIAKLKQLEKDMVAIIRE